MSDLKSPARVQDNKVVMAKLSREEFIKLQKHCDIKKETVNSVTRKAIMAEIDSPVPQMVAGKNLFLYNRARDNFKWSVMLDNGLRVDIVDDLPAEYVGQLQDAVKQAVDERNTYIKKENNGVPIPSKLVREGL